MKTDALIAFEKQSVVPTVRQLLRIAVGLTALVIACSNPFGTSREIALGIPDIEAPLTVSASGSLDVIVVVRVGGCVTFRRLDGARGGANVTIRAVGPDASGPHINCPTDIRDERKAMRINGTFADSVIVYGRQPDGSVLRRRVLVAGSALGPF